jgi:valyl-tRNA synthetase
MIMFGCHFMPGHEQDAAIKKTSALAEGEEAHQKTAGNQDDSVPFRHVYIHALVRDADRQKMSKTKGNVIDPLEIIERFGTDATRFTLAAMAAPGTDIAFSESRTDGYRAFANKIWNAARFMFMNVDRAQAAGVWSIHEFTKRAHLDKTEKLPGFWPATLEDRWILSRYTRVSLDANVALRGFRFHEAANRIYDFFWGDFCDWYLELTKSRFEFDTPEAREATRVACGNLVSLFEGALRLLHPIMPFITEEIWHAMHEGQPPLKSIAFRPFPFSRKAELISDFSLPSGSGERFRMGASEVFETVDLNAETEMAILQDLIVNVRNVRAELKVEPKVKVPVEIFAQEPAIRTMIDQNRGAIERLGNVEKITFVEGSLAKQAGARSTARFDLHVIYERKIDAAAERERLKKDLEKLDKEFANNQRQLGNDQFLAKAPEKVVEGLRRREKELVALIDKIKRQFEELNRSGPSIGN